MTGVSKTLGSAVRAEAARIDCVAYLAHIDDTPESGVGKKVIRQAKGIAKADGLHCAIFVMVSHAALLPVWLRAASEHGIEIIPMAIGKSLLARHIRTLMVAKAIRKKGAAAIYLRQSQFYLGVYLSMLLLPTVMEINSNDVTESRRNLIKRAYNHLTRAGYLSAAKALVFVSRGILESGYFSRYVRKSHIVSNGVDLPSVQPASDTDVQDWNSFRDGFAYRRNGFFLGTDAQPWQGVDKILRLAAKMPEIGFHLVGNISVQTVPPNVKIYGFLPASGYRPIMQRCDFAIGPLALHRKEMDGTSALKVAEYVVAGKPVLLAYEENDLPAGLDCVLQIENIEKNVDVSLGEIAAFVEQAPNLRFPEWVLAGFSAKSKDAQRVAILRAVMGGA